MKVKLKKADEIIVIAGKEKGKRGKIMSIDRNRNRVVIQGVNLVKRFQRKTQENPQGESLELEMPLHLSNVAYYDSKTKQGKKLGYVFKKSEKGELTKKRAIRENGKLREL